MAADVSARVHLVAEKLQLRAQEAQRKGNENASRALSSSVFDLREALALISEQRHLLARRRGEGDDEEDDADAHVQAVIARLVQVKKMMEKKADEMKLKGNENAMRSLQQSAIAVENGRILLLEQQQTIFGLVGRWEKLEVIVHYEKKTWNSVVTSEGTDMEEEHGQEETEQRKLLARVRYLAQVENVIANVFPDCDKVEDVQNVVEKLKQELNGARDEVAEANERLKQERVALEEVKLELERVKKREVVRQEEDAELLEQQRDACQAMEQLVRESDQEIRLMTQDATERAQELQTVRIEMESLVAEKERLVRVYTDEVEELQGQLATAMDALLTKMDEEEKWKANEMKLMQAQLDNVIVEKNDLVKAHADEVEELRRQLENAMASLSAASEKTTQANTEELQTLLASVDALSAEKSNLIKLHANEVKELQKAHLQEVEELCQKYDDAVNDVCRKTDTNGDTGAKNVHAVQTATDNLADIEEDLALSYADKVQALQKAHRDEIDDLRQQLESAISSLSANVGKIDALSVRELQLFRSTENNLTLRKEDLAKIYGNELETLREAYVTEMEDLCNQLEATVYGNAANTNEKTESLVDELQQMRAKVGTPITAIDCLAREHAVESGALCCQVKGAKACEMNTPEDQEEFSADENGYDGEHAENDDVPVMELEEDELQPADIVDEDKEGRSSDGANDSKKTLKVQTACRILQSQVERYDERLQTQQDTISNLEQKQVERQPEMKTFTNDKIETNEIQRAHEADILTDQTDHNMLQARVIKYEDTCQVQQSISFLTSVKERAEHQEQIKFFDDEKASLTDELGYSYGDETTYWTQLLADSENMRESLVAQLNEMKSELAAKSAEQNETAKALMQCKAELCACHSELDAQIFECSQLKSELEVVQQAEDTKSRAMDERMSKLTTELREVAVVLESSRMVDGNTACDFTSRVWQSVEVTELCSMLAPVLTDLMSSQEQIHRIEEQLKSMRKERDNQKLIVGQFMKTLDWRLFAKDGENVDGVAGALDKDVQERLSVAKMNIHCWLDELKVLRDCVEKDLVKLNTLEDEKLQDQKRLVALETSERDLQVLVESLREELVIMRSENREAIKSAESLIAQNHLASIQKQQQQVVQQEEVAELQQQLATIRSDFDRYRARSHTALKKIEKRAELLNGMRKENEELLKQVVESNRQRKQAIAACEDSESCLQEVQRTQEMIQEEFDQFATEKLLVIAKLENEGGPAGVGERENGSASTGAGK
ncbi:unnamed protein product [Peronospora belbahrii]|uniref:Uncharacterized protein n=1 Tax=Peronospora belbahrii TaxID=622444 RepID=A0AAU9LCT7_9STRA|nr:unnamed protein product [Peronospora belbahrii]